MISRAALYEKVVMAGNRGIHNFSLGTLVTYFRLGELPLDNIAFHNDRVLVLTGLPGSARKKAFVFKGDRRDEDLHTLLQQEMVVYSIEALPLPKHANFKEIAYDLPQVFNAESYGKARKYRQRILNPILSIEHGDFEFRRLASTDLYAVKLLHDEWTRWKLTDPKVMKMMFPKQRYMTAASIAANDQTNYRIYGLFHEKKLVSVRAVYVDHVGMIAFGLAFFGASWLDVPRIAETMGVNSMLALRDEGFSVLNCGASLNPKLESFKSHWPLRVVMSHYYSKRRLDE